MTIPGSNEARAQRSLGLTDGIAAFFGGIAFIVTRPALWIWALIPCLIATVLFLGFGVLAVWGGSWLVHVILPDSGIDAALAPSAWATAGSWLLRIVFWIVGVVVSFLLALSFAQPLSGFALETIARKQELALGGRTWPDQPFVASTLRSLRVTFTALAFSLPLLALLATVTFFFPPAGVVTIPLKFVVTSFAVVYDFLDYPLSLRGVGVRSRLGFMRKHIAAVVGFGAGATLLLLVPGVGLLLLPFGVAGATRLVARADVTMTK